MLTKIKSESIPQITRVSADTVVVSPHRDYHAIARIIAGDWNEPGQSIATRPIVATAIRDRYGDIVSLSIHLDGTPARGHVIVGLCNPDLSVRIAWKPAKAVGTPALNHFARQIVAAAWGSEVGR